MHTGDVASSMHMELKLLVCLMKGWHYDTSLPILMLMFVGRAEACEGVCGRGGGYAR